MGFAVRSDTRRWRGGIIPFRIHSSIDDNLEMRAAVDAAIEHWNAVTCIELIPREDAPDDYQDDYVEFRFSDTQCNSPFGRRGGPQLIQCGYASRASIAHEIGHAAGLYHEHKRPDRDSYVVLTDYALNRPGGDYRIVDNGLVLGAYDCRSRMHYRSNVRRIRPVPDGPCAQLSGNTLSSGDVAAVEHLYRVKVRNADTRHPGLTEIALVQGPPGQFLTLHRKDTGEIFVAPCAVNARADLRLAGQEQTRKVADLSRNGIGAAYVSDWRFVTMHRSPQSALQLTAWELDGNSLSPKVDTIKELPGALNSDIVHLGGGRLLTPIVEPVTHRLKLITWFLLNDSRIKKTGDSGNTGPAAKEVATVVLGNGLVATPLITRDEGTLKVVTWRISQQGGAQKIAEDSVGGQKSKLSASVDAHGNLVTAARAGTQGRLVLISWRIADDGQIERLMDSADQAGNVTDTATAAHGGKIVTAIRTTSRKLKLIAWRTGADGGIFRDGDSNIQGPLALDGIAIARGASSVLVSAVRTPELLERRAVLTSWAVS